MRCWLHDGTIYLAGAPDRDDTAFADRLYRRVSSLARYHEGHKRWNMPLARDVIQGLRGLGLEIPRQLVEWEEGQGRLEEQRRRADDVKTADPQDLKRRMEAAGVRFKCELFNHQYRSVAYALKLAACGLFLDTGTGKTAVAATVMQALHDRSDYRRFLVIAPKSILNVGWGEDLNRFSWLSWVDISDPPPRPAVTTCPICERRFKRHVAWRHLRTHMKKFIDRHGEGAAETALYSRHPELLPPGQERRPVTTCPICLEKTEGHVPWSHIRTHMPPYADDDKKAEKKLREEVYRRFPELAPLGRDLNRNRLLRALDDDDRQVFLINPESFKLRLDHIAERRWDMIVVDESSMISNPKAEITRRLIAFGAHARRRVCMTATPRPNSSLDLWSQMAFLDQCLGGNYYGFRREHFFLGYDGYKWLPKDRETDARIWETVSQRSYRVRLEDCVDLPGEVTERMSVRLEGRLLAHYRDMLDKMEVVVENEVVDTSWQIVQMNKLAQITSGYIFDNDGRPHFLEDSPKIAATYEMARRLVESEDRSVVIWVRFPQTEGNRLQDMLSKFGVSTLHGQTRDVETSVRDFKSGRNRVMIAHTSSAKFGHTWTHSNVAIFHSYDYSWENFYQAKRRIYRIGQDSPVLYLVCMAEDTIDEEIMDSVFAKESASDAIVDGRRVVGNLRRRLGNNDQG